MVITGASSGLGYSAALELARRQASLTLVMRNEKKAAEVVENIRKETGNQDISVEIADLALLGDVELLAQRLLEQGRPIHALINNAGALFNERQETAEGIEVNLALLLLSPYRLTLALQPLLAEAHGSRVINVLSGGMYTQKLSVDSLLEKSDQTYQGAAAYAQAKRGLMVATEDLAQRWEKDGIVVNAMHPGWADTPGVESALPLFHRVTRNVLRSPEEGADTMVWLAAAGEAAQVSGQFFLDRKAVPVHLQGRTRETVQERSRLLNFLANYDWPEQVAVAEALGA
jgi:NAD(P)-dependent dehydrogenase (short-subunit alcohol dehydrogenase family)